jgi:hypothetical protein
MSDIRGFGTERRRIREGDESDAIAGDLFEATVAEDADPDQLNAMLNVTVEAFDGGRHLFGPCAWQPRAVEDGIEVPTKGTRALLARTTDNTYWIVAWWPS